VIFLHRRRRYLPGFPASQLPLDRQDLLHQHLFLFPALLQLLKALLFLLQCLPGCLFPVGRIDANRFFPFYNFQFGFKGFDAALAVFYFGRNRILADGDSCTSRIQQAYRFIR